MRTPGSTTQPSTMAPLPTTTSGPRTELRTRPPEMTEPGPMMQSSTLPPATNFAGGNDGSRVRIGQAWLNRLNRGCPDSRSRCRS